jgi:hypothetical protein
MGAHVALFGSNRFSWGVDFHSGVYGHAVYKPTKFHFIGGSDDGRNECASPMNCYSCWRALLRAFSSHSVPFTTTQTEEIIRPTFGMRSESLQN